MERWNNLSTTQKVCVGVAGVATGALMVNHALQQRAPDASAPTREEGPEEHCTFSSNSSYAISAKDGCRSPLVAKQGAASAAPQTVCEVFKEAVDMHGDKPVLKWEEIDPSQPVPTKKNDAPKSPALNEWKTISYNQYYADCKRAAAGFINIGFEKHDAVSVYGFNAPQWHIAALGAILGGGVIAGIYPSDTPEQVEYKVKHSGATVAVVQDHKKLEMLLKMSGNLPNLKAIVVWTVGGERDYHQGVVEKNGKQVLTWETLLTLGSEDDLMTVDERIAGQRPGEACAYIYTSGTTGNPKAVMISHDNIVFEAANAVSIIPFNSPDGERILSYLPLSHVAGMMVDIVCPLLIKTSHATVCFARGYDLKIGTLAERLKAVRPTVFLGVPRVWEKIQESMQATLKANPPTGITKMMGKSGKAINLEYQKNKQMGQKGGKSFFQFIGNAVGSKVKALLGLDACTFAFTGAAPIKVETLEFFGALGININEVYGMSECTGATTWSTDDHHSWGSCGWSLPGTEVSIRTIDESEEVEPGVEGEVCFRGRHIMLGYMANEDLGAEHVAEMQKKNDEAIDSDGWLHSGDKGKQTSAGLVYITGRYKELIIGAGGENVAPVPVEDGVKARCGLISNVMMIGDKRKFNIAVLTLKAGGTGELPGDDNLDMTENGIDPSVTTVSGAMDSVAITAAIKQAIMDTNKDSAACPMPPARIQKFTILPLDFSVATDELTPTFKLKRSVVEQKYHAMVETMYDDKNAKEAYIRYQA